MLLAVFAVTFKKYNYKTSQKYIKPKNSQIKNRNNQSYQVVSYIIRLGNEGFILHLRSQ